MTICSVPLLCGLGGTVAARRCAKSSNPCSQKGEDNSWRSYPEDNPEGPLVASKCDNQIRASHCWCLDLQRKQRGVSLYVLHFLESWTNIYLRPLVGRVLGWLKNFSFVHQPCAFLHLNTAWSLGLWHVLPPQGVHLWHYKIGIDVLLLEWLDYPETAESLFQFFCISLYF